MQAKIYLKTGEIVDYPTDKAIKFFWGNLDKPLVWRKLLEVQSIEFISRPQIIKPKKKVKLTLHEIFTASGQACFCKECYPKRKALAEAKLQKARLVRLGIDIA